MNCFFFCLLIVKKKSWSVKNYPWQIPKYSQYKLYENSYVIEKCHKKEKVKGCFAKRLLSYCVQCVLLLLRFFLLLWEKGLQYFSISKKDFVKGKILNFIFPLYITFEQYVQFLKIFSLLYNWTLFEEVQNVSFFIFVKKYFAIPYHFFVFCLGLTFEFICSCVVYFLFETFFILQNK